MKFLSTLVIVCFLTAAAYSQTTGRVAGTVTYNGGPVANATVTATLTNSISPLFSVTTNASGGFAFDPIEPGEYSIAAVINAGGVLKTSRHIAPVTITNGQSVDLSLVLEDASPINEQVTVSADSPQTIEQVSKTVDVIDGQEMRERADFALVDALRIVPGFRVQQLGGFGRTATIKTRGLRNQDTAILIDGMRFRDASAITGDASAFLSDFTLTSVSRIEVLRGSGSSLYGTNAIGGTIDFQTPRPTTGFHGQLSTAVGGLGLRRVRGNVSDGTGDGRLGFTMGVSRTGYTEGIDGNDNAHSTNFQSRVEYAPNGETNLSARFFVSDAFVRLNANPDTLEPVPGSNFGIIDAEPGVNFVFDRDDPDSTQESKFFNGQLVLTHAFSSGLLFHASYSGLKTSRKNDEGVLGPGFQSASTSIFDGTIQTANVHINWVPNVINQMTAGYEFEHERFGNNGSTPDASGNFFTRAYQSSHTVYVQDLLQLFGRRLQLAGGLRAQFFDLGSPNFSITNTPYSNLSLETPPAAYTFDGAAAYLFPTGTKLRAHVGNGYRIPSLYERFGTFFSSFGGAAFFALGDPNLKPEKSIAFDAGIEQSVARGRVRLSATYFYTRLIDTVGFGNEVGAIGETPRPFGGYLNTRGGIARGAEFSAKVRATTSTDVFASYTYTNSDQAVPQVSGSGVLRTLGIPSQQFTLSATHRVGRFWANIDLLASNSYLAPIFSNSRFNSYVFRFGGNRRADLTAGYSFRLDQDRFGLRVFGTLENVFDHKYFENGFRTPGINGRVGIAFSF